MNENLLFDKYLLMIEYTFRWSGLHLRNHKNYNINRVRVLYCISFVGLNLNVASCVWWFIKQIGKGDSLVSLTYAAPSFTLAFLCDCKSLSLMVYHSYVDKLVVKMRELETKTDLNDIRNKTLTEEPIQFLHSVLKISHFMNWLLIIAFPLMPLAKMAYIYFVFNKVQLEFPFPTEYPFDAYDFKIYPFVMLSHVWGGK